MFAMVGHENYINSSDNNLIPTRCPSCNHPIFKNGVHLVCDNNDKCSEQLIQKIVYYCEKADMDGFSEASIRTLYKEGYLNSIIDLYTAIWDSAEEIEGFGKKKIASIKKEIEKSKGCNIQEFVNRLSIPLVGKKAMIKLKIETIDQFWKFKDKSYVIGRNLIEYIRDPESLRNLITIIEVVDVKQIPKGEVKMKIAMTGKCEAMGRKELVKLIEEKGFEFASSVTKDTDILLCEDTNGVSSKLMKAKKNGTKLMNYTDFLDGE